MQTISHQRKIKHSQAGHLETKIQLYSVLFVVISVQILELLLLQRKYDIFTGGFLQPYSYLTWPERLRFLGFGLWMDLVLFGALSSVWFWIARKRCRSHLIEAYKFVFLSLSVMGIWLLVKFKVLSYFNDTLNFLIIKNLGGGSLLEALSYIVDEAVIVGIGVVVLIAAYMLGLRWVRRYAEPSSPHTNQEPRPSRWILAGVLVLLTIASAAYINSDSSLRYGLKKKTSYDLISSGLDELTDLDRDGFGLFAFPADPESFNSKIYPGALDYPGNGVDEDGYGGDFLWQGPAPDPLASLSPEPGKHILLIVLESARGDLVGKAWRGRVVAPNMTGLAEAGASAKYAYTHTGYTTSSIKALFNRTLSYQHDRIILTDYLYRSGYELSFISGQDESFGEIAHSTKMYGPGRNLFDARSAIEERVYPSKEPGSLRLSEERIVQQFDLRTAEVDWSRPQFFYINLQAAHFPYSHPTMPALINDRPIPRSEISEVNSIPLQATYWNAIAVADEAVGAMVDRLKMLGVYEDTVIMILGDHGESLFDDHFLGHGHALNEAQTRIPLIINRPGLDFESAVGQIDMAEILIRLATDRFDSTEWSDPERPQLQVVGSLNRPQLVGTVTFGEIRTILDLRTRKVFFSDLERWEDFDTASQNPELALRTKTLVDLWERARWEHFIARNKYHVKDSE